ncbi:hypothetical protein L9G16_05120 [Shewanella sp. A25]|nr:hypothetical protein [Shewanella shenzhenensis]
MSTDSLYSNMTLNDLQLAAAYFPILIDIAKHKHCLTYGELVTRAKETYPNLEYVQNAIPVSTGRKLDVVRCFTNERELPDVTSLVINKGDGECGSGFTSTFDPVKARSEVYAYDWSEVSTEFDLYIDTSQKSVTPRKARKKPDALKLLANFYSQHKANYPAAIRNEREQIIELLMDGFSEKEAFDLVAASL